MGRFWTVQQTTGNLTSSGTGVFRGDIQTLEGQFLGDGTALTGVATDAELTTTSGHLQSQIDNLDDTFATDAELTTVSGHLQGQIDAIDVDEADVSSLNGLQGDLNITAGFGISVTAAGSNIEVENTGTKAITGSDGITITSGTGTVDVAGFRTEFVNASGTLQSDIDQNASDIASNTTLITTTSGFLQGQIDSIDTSSSDSALIGAGSVTVTSGSNTITISGAHVLDREFIADSNISQYDLVYITGDNNEVAPAQANAASTVEVVGMALAGATAGNPVDVRLQGIVEGANASASVATGSPIFLSSATAGEFGATPPSTVGTFVVQAGHAINAADIYVNVNSATATENTDETTPVLKINSVSGTITLDGADGNTVLTEGQTITVSGFRTEFVSASGSLQSQINAISAGNVDDINGADGSVTLQGSDFINIDTDTGTDTITVSADAITGSDGITITSGTSTVDVQGFRAEFVSASGSLQTQLDSHTGDATIHFTEASIDHGSISGLGDDDHTQYSLVDGSRDFTGTVGGITPVAGSDFTTKDYVDTADATISGHLQSQIDTNSDHGNLSGLADDDHTQYFLTSATAETTRIVGGNDLVFQSDGSRGTPGSSQTLSVDGATGNLDTEGTLRVRALTGESRFDGDVVIGNLTVTGTETIFNSVTEVVNNLLVSGSATIGDPDTPFEDNLLLRGDADFILDPSRAADTVLELTHSGAAGSLDIAGVNNETTWWSVDNRGNATFNGLTITGSTTGIDHGALGGLGDDDHTQYILADGTRAFSGNQSLGGNDLTSVGDIDASTGTIDTFDSTDATVSNLLTVDTVSGTTTMYITPASGSNLIVGAPPSEDVFADDVIIAGTGSVTLGVLPETTFANVNSDGRAQVKSLSADVRLDAATEVGIDAPRITPTISGATDLGVAADPFATAYIDDLNLNGSLNATSSGTQTIGSSSNPFGNTYVVYIAPSFDTLSASPVRGMIAIDSNNQFVGYNGTDWIILG